MMSGHIQTEMDSNDGEAVVQEVEDECIRSAVYATLDLLTMRVIDKICNEKGTLKRRSLELENDIKEKNVWGVDCYTRKNLGLLMGPYLTGAFKSEYEQQNFVESYILPAVNTLPDEDAHDLKKAMLHIVAKNDDDDVRKTAYEMYEKMKVVRVLFGSIHI